MSLLLACSLGWAAFPAAADRPSRRPQRRAAAARPCRALFDDNADSNGSRPQQPPSAQHASIQHPIFPEAQPAAAGPVLVQTQRGIPLFKPVIPEKPCPQCGGLGKLTCGDCRGKGRLNYRGAAMLPQGAWPQWCPSCRASGRWCCAKCMGTGVRRRPIGFRMAGDDDDDDEEW